MKKVLVFGTFDGLHKGHMFLLKQASSFGEVVVALPEDKTVCRLKGNFPKHDFATRLHALLSSKMVSRVVSGDGEPGTWSVLEEVDPDIVVLGYDQGVLREALQKHLSKVDKKGVEIIVLEPYMPEKYKSSLLNQKQ